MPKDKPPQPLTPDEELAIRIYRMSNRATNAFKKAMAKHVVKFDVSDAQFAMLYVLYRQGSMTQIDLASELGLGVTGVVHLVKALIAKGGIRRVMLAGHRRRTYIEMTLKGKRYMTFLEPGAAWTINEAIKSLSPIKRNMLIELCMKVEQGAKSVGEYTEKEHMRRHPIKPLGDPEKEAAKRKRKRAQKLRR